MEKKRIPKEIDLKEEHLFLFRVLKVSAHGCWCTALGLCGKSQGVVRGAHDREGCLPYASEKQGMIQKAPGVSICPSRAHLQ